MKPERFMVVNSGVKEGKAYSFLKAIREGVKKESGEAYAFLDENSFLREEEQLPLGSVISYERKRVDNITDSKRFATK